MQILRAHSNSVSSRSKEPASRPTAQLLQLIKYFSDPAVHALQFLDVINMKDAPQKNNFYRTTLKDILLYIPRVMKMYVTVQFRIKNFYLSSAFV